MIESIHKAIVNELFNAAHSEVQTHQFILKIYKIVFNFKIVLKSIRDAVVSRFITIFDSKLIFQNFSNLAYQICFEILIYYDSINKAISVSIEFAHFFSCLFCVLISLKCHWLYYFLIHFFHRQQSRLSTWRFLVFLCLQRFDIRFSSHLLSWLHLFSRSKKSISLYFVFVFILKEKLLKSCSLKFSIIRLQRTRISMYVNIKI